MDNKQSFVGNHGSRGQVNGVAERVLVIGAGVSGLTSALCLLRKGFEVTVIADRLAPEVTSVVAGALWEWPPAVCGYHHDQVSLSRSKSWSATSYRMFTELAADNTTGVFLRPVTFYFKHRIEDDPGTSQKIAELKTVVRHFRHDSELIAANGVSPTLGLRDAYTYLAPMIDTDVYMRWLEAEVRGAGGRVLELRLHGLLRDRASALAHEYDASAIVNCAGLGAGELAGDRVYPLRGALIRVRNDGSRIPRVVQAHCVAHNGADDERGFVFIVPRGDNMLVLGGIAEPDEASLDIGLHNYEPIRAMYDRCCQLMPVLEDAEIDAVEPVRVGLRPIRPRNVRLEVEDNTRIVHNYGHGGSGVTLSWGCALEVADSVENLVSPNAASIANAAL
jgi:D-amino-acid oxidase